MDVRLPGIDGLETTRRLKQIDEFKDIPVWAISAHAMKGDDQHALDAGCSDYFSKPIAVKQFAQRLREFIDELNLSGEITCTDC